MNVGQDCLEFLQNRFVRPDFCGLKDGEAAGDSKSFHCTRRKFLAPSSRPVGLGYNELDGVAGLQERTQGWKGDRRTSEEDDPHEGWLFILCLLSFFLIKARLSGDRRSMKSRPSR